ncbi:MAG: cytochrome c [Bacteroidetes bacterium]|nr:MAG: cytochrome c [Bacteroidota bacterium]
MKPIALLLGCFFSHCCFAQTISPTALAAGKALYSTNCLACHQADGKGIAGLHPPLAKTKWVLGSKATLINIVLKGFDAPIEIDGEAYESAMPPQPQLTNQQIADVLTYIRNSFGNKASAVTAAEVKMVRAKK